MNNHFNPPSLSLGSTHPVMRVVRAQRTLSRFNVALSHPFKAEGRGQLKISVAFSLWAGLPVSRNADSPNEGQDGLIHFEWSGATLFRTTRNLAIKTPKKVKPESLTHKIPDGELYGEGQQNGLLKLNCFRTPLRQESTGNISDSAYLSILNLKKLLSKITLYLCT